VRKLRFHLNKLQREKLSGGQGSAQRRIKMPVPKAIINHAFLCTFSLRPYRQADAFQKGVFKILKFDLLF